MEAILLAGGLGTRLRSVVNDLPKPMAPIRGRPFLDYQLAYWIPQGVTRIILSVGYKHESIVDYFGESYRGVPVQYVKEEAPLGTGGAVRLAASQLKGDRFLLLNGDTFVEADLKSMVREHNRRAAAITFSLIQVPDTGRYGSVVLDETYKILGFCAKSAQVSPACGWINAGAYLLETSLISEYHSYPEGPFSFEEECLRHWIAGGYSCYGVPVSGLFVDIGIPADYNRANQILGSLPDPK